MIQNVCAVVALGCRLSQPAYLFSIFAKLFPHIELPITNIPLLQREGDRGGRAEVPHLF